MEDLTQITAGTTSEFIQHLNDNFGKIKNQFDTVNSFIFAEGEHKQKAITGQDGGEITWFYRLYTSGTAECWCTHGVVFDKNDWNNWEASNGTSKSGLFYNTGKVNPNGVTQMEYPKSLEIGNLDDGLKQDIGLKQGEDNDSNLDQFGQLKRLFVNTVKPKCFVTVNSYTGAAMLFTTNRPQTDTNELFSTFTPEVQAVYFSSLPINRTIGINFYVIGRWK